MKRINKLMAIALIAVIGFSMAACFGDDEEEYSLTITGIDSKWNNANAEVSLIGFTFGSGSGTVVGGNLTVILKTLDDSNWTPGIIKEYGIGLEMEKKQPGQSYENGSFLYTNSQELDTLNITSEDDLLLNAPKFSFSSANSTIAFSRFKDLSVLSISE